MPTARRSEPRRQPWVDPGSDPLSDLREYAKTSWGMCALSHDELMQRLQKMEEQRREREERFNAFWGLDARQRP